MSGIQLNSITAAGNAAANTVASSLIPKKHASGLTANAAIQRTLNANAAAAPANSTTSSATAKNISSTDFLTLLVSELKNQDPTKPTDPNEYITQLAQVNSLQQLIDINGGISDLNAAAKR